MTNVKDPRKVTIEALEDGFGEFPEDAFCGYDECDRETAIEAYQTCTIAGMIAALEWINPKEHHYCQDEYYCCPLHPDYKGPEAPDECDCEKGCIEAEITRLKGKE